MAQMLIRVTEEMDEALKIFEKLLNDNTMGEDDIKKLAQMEHACYKIVGGVYDQWKEDNGK